MTLANSVPIETVSKMLGHTDIKTTQHYAKLLDNRVAVDMEFLEQKICKEKAISTKGVTAPLQILSFVPIKSVSLAG